MSIQLIVNANSFPELASLLAEFHLAPNKPTTEPAQPTEAEGPRRRGRPAKRQTIEGEVVTDEVKAEGKKPAMELLLAGEAEATPDTSEAKVDPVPEITHEELRSKIIAWVNDKAAKTPADNDARRKAFEALKTEFGFTKVPEIDPVKFGPILAYLETNAP